MTKEHVNKLDKDRVHKVNFSRSSTVQAKRPLAPMPTHHSQSSPNTHDTHQAAQASWQSILNHRDGITSGIFGGERPIIQAKLTLGPVGDQYEQEADSVAKQVVGKLNNPQGQLTQRQEEDEMHMKPVSALQRQEEEEMMAKRIQRQDEEEEMMAKSTGNTLAGGPVSATLENEIQGAKGGGQPIGDNVRGAMENAFGADFSGVRVHTGSQSDSLNQSIQARAFTTGQDIFFRSGEYNPGSSRGQELLAHELTHVVQQNGYGVQRQKETIQRVYEGVWLDMGEMQREKKAKPSLHIPKKYKKGGSLKDRARRFVDAVNLIGDVEPRAAASYLSEALGKY